MIREYGVPDRDVASDTFVEATVGEDPKRGGEMLLAVQALFLERVELGVGADLEPLAARRLAQGAERAVLGGAVVEDAECWCHCFLVFVG